MNKNMLKMILDIVMIIALTLLYNSHVFTMGFHEIAGLGLFGLFVVHCLLNRKWIAAVSTRLFSKTLAAKLWAGYIVNILLSVTFVLIIISGIATSQVLFPYGAHNSIWRGIHHFFSAISIVLVGIHLGLHWSFVSGMFKKTVKIVDSARKPLAIILLLIVLVFGAYSIVTSNFTDWLTEPFVTQVKDSAAHNDSAGAGKSNEQKREDVKNNGTANVRQDKSGDSAKTVNVSMGSVFWTIASYLSIIAVFAALTHYASRRIFFRKTLALE